jgi:hypothetical protein
MVHSIAKGARTRNKVNVACRSIAFCSMVAGRDGRFEGGERAYMLVREDQGMFEGGARSAGVFRRSAAYLIDIAILLPYFGALFLLSRYLPSVRHMFVDSVHAEAAQFAVLTVPVACWLILNEAKWSATPGKALLSLRVSFSRGEGRLRPAIVRNVLKLLPWELNHAGLWRIRFAGASLGGIAVVLILLTWTLGIIYLGGAIWDRAHRTAYDRISGTRVVRI